MKKKPIYIHSLILCIVLVGVFAVFFIGMELRDRAARKALQQTAAEMNHSQADTGIISYNGENYRANKNIKNYLFIGVDQQEEHLDGVTEPGDAGCADCLLLLTLNAGTGKASILQINRNAMTEIDIYDEQGQVWTAIEGQVCLQFGYCIGGKRSCYAQKKTVSEMLFDTHIDGYLCMNLEGISEINDAFGGVKVTLEKDYPEIDASYQKGATIHLKGKKAEQFVRYRSDKFNSVQDRMERQTIYITAFIDQMKDKHGDTFYDTLSPYLDKVILTDLTSDELTQLRSYSYQTDAVEYLPGEMTMGEKYEEYMIDNDQLQAYVLQTFYEKV